MCTRGSSFVVALCTSAAIVAMAGCDSGHGDKARRSKDSTKAASSASAVEDITALPANEIYEKARTALMGASSLKVVFKTVGDIYSRNEISLDDQGNCAGEITSVDGQRSSRLGITKIGNKLWVKPDASLWWKNLGLDDAEIAKNQGKFAIIRPGSGFDAFASNCNLSFYKGNLEIDPEANLTKGKASEVGGIPVISLTATRKSVNIKTIYVATDGTKFPVRVVRPNAKPQPVTVTFSDFGKPVHPQPPDVNMVVVAK